MGDIGVSDGDNVTVLQHSMVAGDVCFIGGVVKLQKLTVQTIPWALC